MYPAGGGGGGDDDDDDGDVDDKRNIPTSAVGVQSITYVTSTCLFKPIE